MMKHALVFYLLVSLIHTAYAACRVCDDSQYSGQLHYERDRHFGWTDEFWKYSRRRAVSAM